MLWLLSLNKLLAIIKVTKTHVKADIYGLIDAFFPMVLYN